MSEPVDVRTELAKLLSDVDQATAITRDEMQAAENYLGQLWDQTQGDESAHALITQTWDHVKAIAEQTSALTFQVVAGGNMTHTALQEAKAEREARVNLEFAIETGDESHPKLRDFAEMIREDAKEEYEEWMAEDGWPEAMAEAYEEIRGEMVERIQRLTGCGLGAASRYLSVIMGRRVQFTDYQAEMFAAFIDSFEEIVRAEMEARSGS